MDYKKPEVRSYSAGDILEEIGPCQNQYTATFYTTTGNSSVNVDGAIDESGNEPSLNEILVGDDSSNDAYRGFFSFDINSIQGRTVVSATLRMYQVDVFGDPYGDLGNLVIDHVNFGSSLDSGGTGNKPELVVTYRQESCLYQLLQFFSAYICFFYNIM